LAAGFPFVEWPLRSVLDVDVFDLCKPLAPLPVRVWPFEWRPFPLEELFAPWRLPFVAALFAQRETCPWRELPLARGEALRASRLGRRVMRPGADFCAGLRSRACVG
jgi:hypothetical protein